MSKGNLYTPGKLHTQEDALKYICRQGWGYIDELIDEIGEEMFERLKSVGCLECGLSAKETERFCGTWKKTPTADREVKLYDNAPSRSKGIRYRIFESRANG
ncbi:MAG: hypothetical protein LBD89_02460 [Tannerellaceae bacterium]|jgi:hypothetical protein|nr:hypothetical protein [Tannerellaceae bacterium]